MKTSELIGPALDWAVAKCEGITIPTDALIRQRHGASRSYSLSTDWAQGGPIIERERIGIGHAWEGDDWLASTHGIDDPIFYGPTPLIAAMRCYVASKLGDEVELPKELQ